MIFTLRSGSVSSCSGSVMELYLILSRASEELEMSSLEIWLSLELLWLGDGAVSNLVESIRGVGNELSQEDLLVGVEGVDDQTHQLLDIGVERENFLRHLLCCGRFWLKSCFRFKFPH